MTIRIDNNEPVLVPKPIVSTFVASIAHHERRTSTRCIEGQTIAHGESAMK